jgi:phospholipid/cholesterol/gamma-HCH transport system substrate-binding protein
MTAKSQYVKLAVFLLATLGLLAGVLTLVSGAPLWDPQDTYYVHSTESVSGLEEGTTVTMRGVRIGRVQGIDLHSKHFDRVRITLQVRDDVQIPRNAKAYFRLAGVTGLKTLDIDEGSTKAGVLPPGSVIPRGMTTLEQVENQAVELARKASEVTARSSELIEHLADLVQGVDPERVQSIVRDGQQLAERLNDASVELQATLREGRQGLRRIVSSVESAAEGADTVMQDAKIAAGQLRELVQSGESVIQNNEGEVRRALRSLRDASRNLQELSRDLRHRPNRILFSSPPKERRLP